MTDLHTWITRQVDRVEALARTAEADLWEVAQGDRGSAAIALRRCEADRRILERHHLATEWTWQRDPACHGCGTQGDCDDPVTDNLNQCPELWDLAHAHGITDEIRAGLDMPQMPPRPEPKPIASWYANGGTLTPPITTSDVPEALRGRHWKP